MKISVIIPIYNVEKCLNHCVNSIISQSYKDTEIILVNDGSSDNSGKICDDFALEDNRIKVIHKYNGGVSSARNAGLKIAEGKYITFVDGDDYVSSDYFEKLMVLISEKCDWTVFNYFKENKNGNFLINDSILSGIYNEDNFKDIAKLFIETYRLNSPVLSIYLSNIIKEQNITFDENIKMGEDFIFNVNYFKKCKSVYINDVTIYYYTYNKNGATKNLKFDAIDDYEKYFKYCIDLSKKYNLYKNNKWDMNNELRRILRFIKAANINGYSNEQIDGVLFNKNIYDFVLKTQYKNFKLKIGKILLKNKKYKLISKLVK